jgi:catechol 2,3-dioxygenase-like lactoylglutathione lyase family enzyme
MTIPGARGEVRIGFRTTDYEAALAHYRDDLGLAVHEEFPDGGVLLELAPGVLLELLPPGEPATFVAVEVASAAAAHERFAGAAEAEPALQPWGHLSFAVPGAAGAPPLTIFEVVPSAP